MGNTGFRIKTPPLCRRTARCLKKTICGLIIHNLRTRIKGNSHIIHLIWRDLYAGPDMPVLICWDAQSIPGPNGQQGGQKDGIPSPLEGIPSLIHLPLHCQLKNHGLNWLYLCPGTIPPL